MSPISYPKIDCKNRGKKLVHYANTVLSGTRPKMMETAWTSLVDWAYFLKASEWSLHLHCLDYSVLAQTFLVFLNTRLRAKQRHAREIHAPRASYKHYFLPFSYTKYTSIVQTTEAFHEMALSFACCLLCTVKTQDMEHTFEVFYSGPWHNNDGNVKKTRRANCCQQCNLLVAIPCIMIYRL